MLLKYVKPVWCSGGLHIYNYCMSIQKKIFSDVM